MKRIIGKLLIIIGIVIIGAVAYININISNQNKELVKQYKSSTESTSTIKQPNGVVGILDIPKIDLEVAIKSGTGDDVLDNSIGHFENSAMPGEVGNFAVAGHRNYTSNKFFSNLDDLEVGDELNVLSNGENHTYKVNHIEVVEPSQVEVVESTDKKEITLVTCTPKYVGSHRLIVKGECVD